MQGYPDTPRVPDRRAPRRQGARALVIGGALTITALAGWLAGATESLGATGSASITLAGLPQAQAATSSKPHPRCRKTGRRPARVSLRELRIDTRCLINRTRAKHGLHLLDVSRPLRRVATGHSLSMVRSRYFAHGSAGSRIVRSGYLAGASSWAYGEVIAYGCHRDGSAKLIFRRWMRSPGHRAAILTPRFRDIGVGVARGDPTGGGGKCATYTVDLGLSN